MIKPSGNILTIFTTCKAFKGETANMQWNALRSWHALQKVSNFPFNILIMGSDDGSEEAAREIKAEYIPSVKLSENGIPLVSGLFEQAKKCSDSPFLAYINSDIILREDFINSISTFLDNQLSQPFLLTVRRINIPLNTSLVETKEGWQTTLDKLVEQYGSWDLANAVDIFLFNRDLFKHIPDFSIGRMQWDNWLLWKAREEKAMVIDGSLSFGLLHPIHGYTSHAQGWQDITQGNEAIKNRRLAAGNLMNLESATTHIIQEQRLSPITEKLSLTLKNYCQTAPQKEFIAFLYQLNQQIMKGSKYINVDETADIFRTLLWRNKKFITQEKVDLDNKTFIKAIEMAYEHSQAGDLSKALNIIEDTLANKLLTKIKYINRPIIIWGTGDLAKRLKIFLERQNIPITGFADSNAKKTGHQYLTLPVFGSTASEITKQFEHKPFFIIGSMFVEEIYKALLDQGFYKNSDFTS